MLTGWGSSFWQDELTYFYEGNLIFSVFLFGDILLGPLKAYYQNGILV
jgi:antitoxin component YwqK of YwqJK toxin-antitoxin module